LILTLAMGHVVLHYYGYAASAAKSRDRDVVKVVCGIGGRIYWSSTFC